MCLRKIVQLSFLLVGRAMMFHETERSVNSELKSLKIFNNNNEKGATTLTRYVHVKHADSTVKIFKETTV